MTRRKSNIYIGAAVTSVLAIVFVLVYGMSHKTTAIAAEAPRHYEEDVYVLDERSAAEFQPVLIEKFNEESELTVLSVDASEELDLKQMGIFDWSILNKTQTLSYKGCGTFYVDLSSLGAGNIRLDNDKKAVVIEIPHTKMAPIEIDPERFEAGETKKGFLAFGELRFTAKEYNELEKEIRGRIYEAVHTEENLKKADERAVSEMKKLYEPVVRMVDDEYGVEIVFIGEN